MASLSVIADGGATKTDWAVICSCEGEADKISLFTTPGMNASTTPPDKLEELVNNAVSKFPRYDDSTTHIKVRYYGSGCTAKASGMMTQIITAATGTTDVVVDSDMVGTAKALFGNNPGIACILGTGSNTSFYDGTKIARSIPPMGWILGDEGSGAHMGKLLVNKIYKRLFPEEIIERFYSCFNMSYPELVERIYCQPAANVWLASLTRFIAENIHYRELETLVNDSFEAFVSNNLSGYGPGIPIGFCGSIAHHFQAQLCSVLARHGYPSPLIIQKPLPRLIEMHAML